MGTQLSTVNIRKNSSAILLNIVKQLSWSPSGNQLACLLKSNSVALMKAYEGGGVRTIDLDGKADLISWNGSDSRLFIAYEDGGIGYLDVEEGKLGKPHSAQRRRFIFLDSHLGDYIGVTETGRIVGGNLNGYSTLTEGIGSVTAASFHGRGIVARSGSGLETVFARHKSSGNLPNTIISQSTVNCHAWNNDGKFLLMGLSNSGIQVCDLMENKTYILDGHDSEIIDISVCADDRFAATLDKDGNIFFWDLFTRTRVNVNGDKFEIDQPTWIEFKPRTYLIALGNLSIGYYNTDFIPSKVEDPAKDLPIDVIEKIQGLSEQNIPQSDNVKEKVNDIESASETEERTTIIYNENMDLVHSYQVFLGSLNDVSAKSDTLGFKPYTEGLLNFLLSKDTYPPLTVSIEGEWGEGKTSFMQQMKRKIDESSAPKTLTEKTKAFFQGKKTSNAKKESYISIWFQPWKYEKEEALWAVFALEFIRQTKSQINILRRPYAWLNFLWMRLKSSDSKFDLFKHFLIRFAIFTLVILAGATVYEIGFPELKSTVDIITNSKDWGWLIEVGKFIDKSPFTGHLLLYIVSLLIIYFSISNFLVKNLKGNLKRILNHSEHTSKMPYIENLHSDIMLMIKSYCKSKRVFVFLDDLDRCETPKAADFIQSITMMLPENASTILILGIDKEKLAASISAKHIDVAKIISGTDNQAILKYGYDYLSKFIQIPFQIPRAQAINLRKMLGIRNSEKETTKKYPRRYKLFKRFYEDSDTIMDNSVLQVNALGDAQSAPISQPQTIIYVDSYQQNELTNQEAMQIMEVGILLSSTLDFNPRKLKQFMNLFRLSVFLAESTNLLRTSSTPNAPLTLEIIGKYVALSIRWPSVVAYVQDKPHVLAAMQRRVFPGDIPSSLIGRQKTIYQEYNIEKDDIALSFLADSEFREFLLAGIYVTVGEVNENYAFRGIEIDSLITIAAQ